MHIAFAAPAEALCTDACERAGSNSIPTRLARLLVGAWLRSIERRTEAALRQLDHAGLLEDFQASRRDC
jgi:hypothetical protein